MLRKERDFWINCVRNVQRLARESGNALDEKAILRSMKANLGSDPADPPDLADKLDAPSRMLARLYAQSLATKDAYTPESEQRRGDAFDLDLLFAIPLPAVIVTADEKFVNRLRGTRAPHHQQVCLIKEFNEHLRKGTLPSLVSGFRTPAGQFRQWQDSAYFRWEGRGRRVGDDWADWFATEPIA